MNCKGKKKRSRETCWELMQEFRVKIVACTVIYLSGRGSDKHLGSKNILKIELGGLADELDVDGERKR